MMLWCYDVDCIRDVSFKNPALSWHLTLPCDFLVYFLVHGEPQTPGPERYKESPFGVGGSIAPVFLDADFL